MMFFRKIDDIRYEIQFDRPYNLKEVLNFISKNIIDSYPDSCNFIEEFLESLKKKFNIELKDI